MPSAKPWFHKWKDRKRDQALAQIAGPGARADFGGGLSAESTTLAYDYLLGSLRINAPGYADQDAFQMSKDYLGVQYLGIHTNCVQAGQAEVKLFEQQGADPEDREPLSIYEDVHELINNPNPDDSFGEILEQISLQHDLTGTALVWVPRDPEEPRDPPREIYCLSTASALPQPISPRYPQGAYLVQPWYPAGPYAMIPVVQGVGATIPAEQIIRIKKSHPFFRWIGYSTLYAIASQIDVGRMIDVSRTNAFRRGIDPSAILSFDPSVSRPDEATLRRLEAQFAAVWGGPQNTGRVAVAPAGAELTKLSNTPSEMAYQEGWMQLLEFSLAAIGVPRAVAGITEGLTYATLYASYRGYYLQHLQPHLNKVADKFTRCLLQPDFDRSFGMELKGKAITDDSVLDAKAKTLGQFGAIRIGELRKMYELPPSDRDDEWIRSAQDAKEATQEKGAGQSPEEILAGLPGASGEEGHQGDPDQLAMQRQRPDNPQAAGSQGPRKTLSQRHEQIMGALDRHLTKGHIQPIKNGK